MTDVITRPELELEGTWEEILAHAPELAGRRVRVIVLPTSAHNGTYNKREQELPSALTAENQRLLAVLDELKRTPWSAEEMAALDGFEQFNKEHPITLDWQPKDDQ